MYRGSRLSYETPSSGYLGRYPGNSYSAGVRGGVTEMARDGFGLVAVAHLRLARMYHQLSHVCVKWGEPDRARGYMRRADAHLAEADHTGAQRLHPPVDDEDKTTAPVQRVG